MQRTEAQKLARRKLPREIEKNCRRCGMVFCFTVSAVPHRGGSAGVQRGLCDLCRAYAVDWKNYRLTGPEAHKLRSRGACDLCGKALLKTGHIDHCHVTGRVRGILCNLCNLGLGAFRDDADALRLAADYLEGGGLDGE